MSRVLRPFKALLFEAFVQVTHGNAKRACARVASRIRYTGRGLAISSKMICRIYNLPYQSSAGNSVTALRSQSTYLPTDRFKLKLTGDLSRAAGVGIRRHSSSSSSLTVRTSNACMWYARGSTLTVFISLLKI
ncbi:hypothetical protein C8Q80DRAFT_473158 [Daedaleopsis nitida]|nr:hypothetical protein C8Q80DRAFT_473158 [Daedaleopsis nitida]